MVSINTSSRRTTATIFGIATLLGGGLLLMRANATPGARKDTAPSGKITPWQAMKIATAKTPGKPIWANFEFEDGKWIYGVVVASGKTLHEVEIDATTGKVGDSEVITPAQEGKEATQELNAAIGNRSAARSADEKGEKE